MHIKGRRNGKSLGDFLLLTETVSGVSTELRRSEKQLLITGQSKQMHSAGSQSEKETIATRKASQACLNHFAKILPEFMGACRVQIQ